MGANSLPPSFEKILHPLFNERSYTYVQAVSKALDIRSGSWSEPEIDLIKYAVKPGKLFLTSANYGLYSYHLSSLIGDGKIYAFEPVPLLLTALSLSAGFCVFTNVELHEKGCSSEKGQISFSVPVQQSGAVAPGLAYIGSRNDEHSGKDQFDTGNFHTTYAQQVRWTETREVDCEVIALDEFLPSVRNLSLIKIDVEGAELFAFRGAEKLISEHLPSVICEINPWYLQGFGVKTEELIDFFTTKGYRIFFYSRENGRGELSEVRPDEIVEDNYFFIHPSRFERFSALLPENTKTS